MRSSCSDRCKPNPQGANFIYQQAKIRFDCHQTKPQSTRAANIHRNRGGGGGGKTRCTFILAAIDRLTTCKPEGQLIDQQAKIIFHCHRNRMLGNHTCQRGEGGNRKKMQSSLLCAWVGVTTCKPSTSTRLRTFDCHRNRMLENHTCPHPTGPQEGGGGRGETERRCSVLWVGVGGEGWGGSGGAARVPPYIPTTPKVPVQMFPSLARMGTSKQGPQNREYNNRSIATRVVIFKLYCWGSLFGVPMTVLLFLQTAKAPKKGVGLVSHRPILLLTATMPCIHGIPPH